MVAAELKWRPDAPWMLVGVRAASGDFDTRARTDLLARRLKACADPTPAPSGPWWPMTSDKSNAEGGSSLFELARELPERLVPLALLGALAGIDAGGEMALLAA